MIHDDMIKHGISEANASSWSHPYIFLNWLLYFFNKNKVEYFSATGTNGIVSDTLILLSS